MQTQLTTLSQARAWGEVEKHQWDMAFLMIVPSNNSGSDQVCGLAAMWVHPQQGHLPTLVEAAWKLMILVDSGPDWLYAFICINDSMLHVPLSDKGHIGTKTDGVCSTNACSQLHQLQVWKLLQHSDSGIPRGTKWGVRGSSVLFPGAATLETLPPQINPPQICPL